MWPGSAANLDGVLFEFCVGVTSWRTPPPPKQKNPHQNQKTTPTPPPPPPPPPPIRAGVEPVPPRLPTPRDDDVGLEPDDGVAASRAVASGRVPVGHGGANAGSSGRRATHRTGRPRPAGTDSSRTSQSDIRLGRAGQAAHAGVGRSTPGAPPAVLYFRPSDPTPSGLGRFPVFISCPAVEKTCTTDMSRVPRSGRDGPSGRGPRSTPTRG